MNRGALLALVLLGVLLLAGGGAVAVVAVKMTEERLRVRRALRAAATRYKLNADFVDALGFVEGPYWKLGARSTDPRDEARGGSWGPTQISEKTARAHGYTGAMSAFQSDANLAAEWTGIILAAANRLKRLDTLADYVAAWNAGRNDADKNNDGKLEELPPEHHTRKVYLPLAEKGLDFVRKVPA